MKRFIYASTVAAMLLCGCAHAGKTTAGYVYPFSITKVSQGLPEDGLWRQQLSLHDMNSDGMLDIVAPPARKARDKYYDPAIFLFDAAESAWRKGAYEFPLPKNYGYGGIAVGDLDNNGTPDIALAVHSGGIMVLSNTGDGRFTRVPFNYKERFSSRSIAIDDLDGDGWNDIAAFAEVSANKRGEIPAIGLLLGMNRKGNEWEAIGIEASRGISGDSIATGDINGDGKRDILTAPLTNINENKKIVWFGDGKGEFAAYEGDLAGDLFTSRVRAGNIDSKESDELIVILDSPDLKPPYFVHVFLWNGSAFEGTLSNIECPEMPAAIDLADIDGDNRKEVFVLYRGGIDIFKYTEPGWAIVGHQELPAKESIGVYDLRAGVNRDGSILIAYNLGNEPNPKSWNNGLRAYLVKPANRE